MAPALTKILKDGHGIHLSSRPAAVRLDSAMCSRELEPQMTPTHVDSVQTMWQNLPLFPSLDSCLPMIPLDTPANTVLSQCLLESANQCETDLLSGPPPLLILPSPSEVLKDSHQVASVFPGVSDMLLVRQHNGQEACLLHACKPAPNNGPDGGHIRHFHSVFATSPPLYSHGDKNHQFCTPPPLLTQEKVSVRGLPPLSSMQSCSESVNSDQLPSRVILEEAVQEHLSRQAGLQNRAQGLQRRLQALLGEHAVLHCTQQLEGLKKLCGPGGGSLDSLGSILPLQGDSVWLGESTALSSLAEVGEFSVSGQAVLRGLQEDLDSDATVSSSSDEEQEEGVTFGNIKTSPACERQWLEERAELGSRWSWLQLRLSELEGRIQQMVELHKHIRSIKGGVVLADSQPLTDYRVQPSLLREMGGLSCRALDSDPEPYSPNRLLHNIERQSAQLSQLVNSLMPPLSLSPLSKQPHTLAFTSCRKRRLGTRKLKADACARTRPLAVYHKPKLFTVSAFSPNRHQDLETSTSNLSSSLLTSSCSGRSSCDPVILGLDPDCSSGSTSSSRTSSPKPQPVRGHSLDAPLYHHLTRVLAREEWHQRPLFINAQPCGSAHRKRCSSTPEQQQNSHKYKQHGGFSQHSRASQRKPKRRPLHRLTEDKGDYVFLPGDIEDSSDEVLMQSNTDVTHKQASQGLVRKRKGVSVCNINSVVIPLSVAKVEKLQYKDILTPSWRVVDTSPVVLKEGENREHCEEGQMEDLTDEIFERRHLVFELREKLRSGSWGKTRCCRRRKRSGSRLSASGGGICTSGEESAMETCARLDIDEQQSSKEWLPQIPWKLRLFPLSDADDEEEALLSYYPEFPSEFIHAVTKSKNPNYCLFPPGSCGATLSSGGQEKSTSINGS
ncbi:KAT8 regulatory NSL complex subunit 1-like protein isoform X2 [Antennarius striatus]|uniref:KAT8 regulatory NSL complex subunit 1-like protein isoform X2 n=1 Tax=Antennarius striatus TaxID=241820 RepID=UPI0035B4D495